MGKKIAITTESSADLSKQQQKEHDIHVIPMNVMIGDEEFRDGVDLTAAEMFEKAELYGVAPKTSGISPHEYKLVFQTLTEKGFDVIHISISSRLSSCYQNAQFSANGFENVFVVDSCTLSAGMALLCLEADRLRNMGKPTSEIAQGLEKLKTQISTSFLLENTDYLFKGGRCSALEKAGADLLSLRPSVTLENGQLVPGKKYMGKISQARKKYIDDKLQEAETDSDTCFLNHTGLSEQEIQELAAYIKETARFNNVLIGEAGCCISAHCGKGCMGVIFKGRSGSV